MKEILEEVLAILARNSSCALATILTARGSLPMSRRSKMVVRSDGSLLGTVGGGCLEAEITSLALRLQREGLASIRRFTLTEAKAGAEGLNCGGTVEILVEPVGEDPLAIAGLTRLFGAALAALIGSEETVLATAIEGDDPCRIIGRALIGWKGTREATGLLADRAAGIASFVEEEALAILGQDRAVVVTPPQRIGTDREGVTQRVLLETVSIPPTLYLFGGGHVSLAVARVARTAGFRLVVIDDRPAFSSPERFPEADQTWTLPLDRAVGQLPIDASSYIVAVTRGHQYDEPVVEQALGTKARYIGMIGSRRKVALLWKKLKERGATEESLARVRAPIGLPIGADSPGEIAVSIVAQLIEERRKVGR